MGTSCCCDMLAALRQLLQGGRWLDRLHDHVVRASCRDLVKLCKRLRDAVRKLYSLHRLAKQVRDLEYRLCLACNDAHLQNEVTT